MQFKVSLVLIASCAAATVHSMDTDEKALALKAQFATISWFQNAETVKVVGLSDTEVSKESAAQLQQAFLTCLQAPGFEFPDTTCPIPVLCIDLKKLAPLLEAVQQLKQTAEEKAEKLRKKEEQEKKDKLIAELIQKRRETANRYQKLEDAMMFVPECFIEEYWESDLPQKNKVRLHNYGQDLARIDSELNKLDPHGKRYAENLLNAWQLDA